MTNLTHLFIKGLVVEAEIGVWPHEKGRQQILRIDVDLTVDNVQTTGDDYAQAVCYDAVTQKILRVIGSQHFNLLEWLAECLAQSILQDDRIHAVRIRIEKPSALENAQAAGVDIDRRQQFQA